MKVTTRITRDTVESADLLVVGSGFFGATIAERAASEGYKVVVIDRRSHIGGNAFSELDAYSGVEVHRYGSHLFHTSNQRVWEYAKKFTRFNHYRHVVWTTHNGKPYPMPINLATIGLLYGRSLSPSEAEELIRSESSQSDEAPQNLEEKAIALVGRPIYEALLKGYTLKQWQTDPKLLPPDVIARLPVRFNYDNSYFSDTWEGLPTAGYTAWIECMLTSPRITVGLEADFFEMYPARSAGVPVVYTGPIDRFFDYREGTLNWRTLDFVQEHHETDDFLGTAVMNYADVDVPYTRIHEFKHLHPERRHIPGRTVIMYEYSRVAKPNDEPYYPVNTGADRIALGKYRERARRESQVFFGGRLGSYQYLDMHMAIASALTKWESRVSPALKSIGGPPE